MKKFLLVIFIGLFSLCSFAEDQNKPTSNSADSGKTDNSLTFTFPKESSGSSLDSSQKLQDGTTILDNVKGLAGYNAVILGYAVYCDFKKPDVQSLEIYFVSIINKLNLSNEDYGVVKDYFMSTFKIAKERGPSNSGMTCDQFKVEFDKMYEAVKSGTALN